MRFIKKIFIYITIVTLTTGCTAYKYGRITGMTISHYRVDSTCDALADKAYLAIMSPMKNKIDSELNVVIGVASRNLGAGRPESLLSNFSADMYRSFASTYLKLPVDIGIVNMGGLRTGIPAGNITKMKAFELMPFENELVILWVKGDQLKKLLDFFASVNGEGVSGIKMGIKEGKAVDITVGGQPLDVDKTYVVATSNFLAEGNDGMKALTVNTKSLYTGIKIRNMIIDYIQSETLNGKKMDASLDGRIYNAE